MSLGQRKSLVDHVPARPSRLVRMSTVTSSMDPVQMMYFTRTFRAGKGGFKTPLYQNTYRLVPRNQFEQEQADNILRLVMEQMLRNTVYNEKEAPAICQRIAKRIQVLLFKKNYERHKVVVIITIMEKNDSGVLMSIQHLWDATKDRYSTYIYENPSLCATGIISAFYYD